MADEGRDGNERISTPAVGSDSSSDLNVIQETMPDRPENGVTIASSTVFHRADSFAPLESPGVFQFGRIQMPTQVNKSISQPLSLHQPSPQTQASTAVVLSSAQILQEPAINQLGEQIGSSPPTVQSNQAGEMQNCHEASIDYQRSQSHEVDIADVTAIDRRPARSITVNSNAQTYQSHAANQEMDEALQIVAHTWAKFQSPLLHQNEELAKELDHAKMTIQHLHEQLNSMQSDMNNQSTSHDDQKILIERMKQTFSRVMSYIQGLGKDVDSLRVDQNNQRRHLENLRKDSLTVNHARGQITAQCIGQYFKARDTMIAMSRIMVDLRIQLEASQAQGQYLLIQLEEKTGLLVEARDELALRQAHSNSLTEQLAHLTSIIKSNHTDLKERLSTSSSLIKAEMQNQSLPEILSSTRELTEQLKSMSAISAMRKDELESDALRIEILKQKEENLQLQAKNTELASQLSRTKQRCRDVECRQAQSDKVVQEMNEQHCKFKLDVEKLWKEERQRHEHQVSILQKKLQNAKLQSISGPDHLLLDADARSLTPASAIQDAAELVLSTTRATPVANTGVKLAQQHSESAMQNQATSLSSSLRARSSSSQIVSSPTFLLHPQQDRAIGQSVGAGPGVDKRQASEILSDIGNRSLGHQALSNGRLHELGRNSTGAARPRGQHKVTKGANQGAALGRSRITRSMMKTKFDERFEEELRRS